MTAQAPNITGGVRNTHVRNNVGGVGCGYGVIVMGSNRSAYTGAFGPETSGTNNWSFNASRSSSVYNDSAKTITPLSIKSRFMIRY